MGGRGRVWRLWKRRVALLLFVGLAAGCGAAGDLEDIKATQRQILKRLAALERNDQALLSSLRSGNLPVALDPGRIYDIPVNGSPSKGPEDATVTVVEFIDFQCPFSRSALDVIDEVMAAYSSDVRLIVKQFPLAQLHRDARMAAKAALAAHRQGKFWKMYEELFRRPRSLDYGHLRKCAEAAGLDLARFETDMASAELETELRADIASGRSAKVTGTPTFFVNGMRVTSRSFEAFKSMIDEALAPPSSDS